MSGATVGIRTTVTVGTASEDFSSANVYESLDDATAHAAALAEGTARGVGAKLSALLTGEARRREGLAAGVAAAEPETPQEPATAAIVQPGEPEAVAHAESLRTVMGGTLAASHASSADDVTAEKRV